MTTDDTLMLLASVGYIIKPHMSLPNVCLISNLILNLAFVGQIYDANDYLVMFFFFLLCSRYVVSKVNSDRS